MTAAFLLGAEAGYITPGCAGALALAAAACVTGNDAAKMARLPDTTGMKNEIVIQKIQRYKYDRCCTIIGARYVEAGDANGTTAEQLEAAIGPRTAAVLCWEHGAGALSIEEVLKIAHAHDVPVIADAAGRVYPTELMKRYPALGVDLICYASKYFGGPNSGGMLLGRRDLVKAAAAQGFIGFENGDHGAFGRPLKLDRQEVVGLVAALEEWLEMDHSARLRGLERRLQPVAETLRGIPGVTVTPLPAPPDPATRLLVIPDPAVVGKTAPQIGDALLNGYPSIWVGGYPSLFMEPGCTGLTIVAQTMTDEDAQVLASRLREVLLA